MDNDSSCPRSRKQAQEMFTLSYLGESINMVRLDRVLGPKLGTNVEKDRRLRRIFFSLTRTRAYTYTHCSE